MTGVQTCALPIWGDSCPLTIGTWDEWCGRGLEVNVSCSSPMGSFDLVVSDG